MILKICGITNQPDADAAIAAGATAIGFNFYPKSPRYIAPESAARIATPGVRRVGVFVNEPAARITEDRERRGARRGATCTATRLPVSIRLELQSGRRYASLQASIFRNGTRALPRPCCSMVPPPNSTAGQGTRSIGTLAHNIRHRIVVAGGLDASNVARAISLAHPWGVDSCSRIESSPGKKDHMKMIDFLHAAKAALGA